MKDPVEVADGKYTFFLDDDGLLNCLRWGEPWPAFRNTNSHLDGSQLALYHDLRDARKEAQDLRDGKWDADEAQKRAWTALKKINEIRNSIIGLQTINWSEHIYPLVAALNEAGIEGLGYPINRERFGTMLERTLAAEKRVAELEARLNDVRLLRKGGAEVEEPELQHNELDDLQTEFEF